MTDLDAIIDQVLAEFRLPRPTTTAAEIAAWMGVEPPPEAEAEAFVRRHMLGRAVWMWSQLSDAQRAAIRDNWPPARPTIAERAYEALLALRPLDQTQALEYALTMLRQGVAIGNIASLLSWTVVCERLLTGDIPRRGLCASFPYVHGAVVMLADPGALALIDRVLAEHPAQVLVADWALVAADLKPSHSMRVIQTSVGRNHMLAHDAWILGRRDESRRPADLRLSAASAATEALEVIEQQLAGRRLVVLTTCERTQRILFAAATVEDVNVVLVGDTDTWASKIKDRLGTVPRGTLSDGGGDE